MELYLRNNRCTIVLFDLDGTFYPRSFYESKYTEFLISALYHYFKMDRETALSVLRDNDIISSKSNSAKSFTEFIISRGILTSDWNNFRDANYKLTGFEKTCVVTETSLRTIGVGRLLFLVSNNSLKTINRILKEISIPSQIFNHIYSSEQMIEGNSKKQVYRQIKRSQSCSYTEMVAIGDRYISDLKPLIELGGNGILVNSPVEIENIAQLLSV